MHTAESQNVSNFRFVTTNSVSDSSAAGAMLKQTRNAANARTFHPCKPIGLQSLTMNAFDGQAPRDMRKETEYGMMSFSAANSIENPTDAEPPTMYLSIL